MKVKELIKQLSTLSPDAEILLSKDAEGNDFRRYNGYSEEFFLVEKNNAISVFSIDDEEDGDTFHGDRKCVILWPR